MFGALWHHLYAAVSSLLWETAVDIIGRTQNHSQRHTHTHTHTHICTCRTYKYTNHKLNMNFIHVSTPTHTRLQCKCCNLLWVCIKHSYIHTYINPYEYSLNKHTPTWSTQTDNVETKQKEKKARGRSKVEESWRRSRTTRDGENKQR